MEPAKPGPSRNRLPRPPPLREYTDSRCIPATPWILDLQTQKSLDLEAAPRRAPARPRLGHEGAGARPDLRAHPRGPRPGHVFGPEARPPEGLAGRLTSGRRELGGRGSEDGAADAGARRETSLTRRSPFPTWGQPVSPPPPVSKCAGGENAQRRRRPPHRRPPRLVDAGARRTATTGGLRSGFRRLSCVIRLRGGRRWLDPCGSSGRSRVSLRLGVAAVTAVLSPPGVTAVVSRKTSASRRRSKAAWQAAWSS